MSQLISPLTDLLRKDITWFWSEECQNAFDTLKSEITSDKILIHYDPHKKIVLATDASDVALGACVSHRFEKGEDRPIAFASRKSEHR